MDDTWMTVISTAHQDEALKTCERLHVHINYINNCGMIKNARANELHLLIGNIERIVRGADVKSTLPTPVGKSEGNSQKEISGLHDGPNSKPA